MLTLKESFKSYSFSATLTVQVSFSSLDKEATSKEGK